MKIPTHPTLLRRMIDSRLKKLTPHGPLLGSATLVQIAKHCGRKGCHCQRGEKHVGNYLMWRGPGKNKTVYVPLDLLEDVRQWIAESRRLKLLIREISQLNLALISGHVKALKRQGKYLRPSAKR